MVSDRSHQKCPDAPFPEQLAWIERQLHGFLDRRAIERLSPGRWRLVLRGHEQGRKQRVYLTALEDVSGAADLVPDLPEPCLHIASPFLSSRRSSHLTVEAARRALKYPAQADHIRVAWCRHPDGSEDVVLAAVHTLFLQDLDTLELAAALHDIAHHADKLESMFSPDDLE